MKVLRARLLDLEQEKSSNNKPPAKGFCKSEQAIGLNASGLTTFPNHESQTIALVLPTHTLPQIMNRPDNRADRSCAGPFSSSSLSPQQIELEYKKGKPLGLPFQPYTCDGLNYSTAQIIFWTDNKTSVIKSVLIKHIALIIPYWIGQIPIPKI